MNSLPAIVKYVKAGGWRVTGIMVHAESATAPMPRKYLPYETQRSKPVPAGDARELRGRPLPFRGPARALDQSIAYAPRSNGVVPPWSK